MRAAAVIVAAGAAKRFGGKLKKQFVSLGGKPVFMRSVLEFRKLSGIQQIVLVVPRGQVPSFKDFPLKFGIDIAAGGDKRTDSVRAGLSALREEIDIVAIHDGARPLITSGLIKASLLAAEKYGAAVVCVPARDTVKTTLTEERRRKKEARANKRSLFVGRTIPRDAIWLAQTPQTFRKKIIMSAYAKLKTKNITDDAQAAELAGYKVRIVPGSYSNIKITDKKDIKIAKMLLK
ncbi:MAG: 2-C-methyl-D-erythritol 4-phosphate cytidylyltransferase [Elusimicrobiota bacterium]